MNSSAMQNPKVPGRKGSSSTAAGAAATKGPTTQCCTKDGGIKRGPWTPEEDEVLAEFVRREGEGKWRMLPRRAGLRRCGKSCRLRWMNYLRPSIRRGPISLAEEDLILRLHRLLGNSKKLISQGIDPRTHKPLSENTYSSNNNFHHHNNYHDVSYKLDSVPTTRSVSPLTYTRLNSSPISALLGEAGGAVQMQDEPSNFLNGMNMNLEVETRPDHQWRNTEGLDGFGDEVFSSFLDSLISDDSFLQPQQQNQINGNVNTEDNIAGGGVIASRELGFEGGQLGTLWDAPSNPGLLACLYLLVLVVDML